MQLNPLVARNFVLGTSLVAAAVTAQPTNTRQFLEQSIRSVHGLYLHVPTAHNLVVPAGSAIWSVIMTAEHVPFIVANFPKISIFSIPRRTNTVRDDTWRLSDCNSVFHLLF